MSTMSATPLSASPEELYTIHGCPSGNNSSEDYRPEERFENMSEEEAKARRRRYSLGLYKFHNGMKPDSNTAERKGSGDSNLSTDSTSTDPTDESHFVSAVPALH